MDLNALRKIQYGMFVIGSKKDGRMNGQIANTVFQVTAEPPTVAACINKQNLTHEFIRESGVFSVSILSEETPLEFIGRFGFKSGRDMDKFKEKDYVTGVTGAPVVLKHAVAYLDCTVTAQADAGTHTLFLGTVVGAETLCDAAPMTYAYYHRMKGGTTPKNAPTFVNAPAGTTTTKEGTAMKKYKCTVCGYVYDPEKGDIEHGIKPGTPFEQLPDTWTCPVCGAPKSAFEPE